MKKLHAVTSIYMMDPALFENRHSNVYAAPGSRPDTHLYRYTHYRSIPHPVGGYAVPLAKDQSAKPHRYRADRWLASVHADI